MMCILMASPWHTAINYLQNHYQSLGINKPAALCVPALTTLDELLGYTEPDLMKALPVHRPRALLGVGGAHS